MFMDNKRVRSTHWEVRYCKNGDDEDTICEYEFSGDREREEQQVKACVKAMEIALNVNLSHYRTKVELVEVEVREEVVTIYTKEIVTAMLSNFPVALAPPEDFDTGGPPNHGSAPIEAPPKKSSAVAVDLDDKIPF